MQVLKKVPLSSIFNNSPSKRISAIQTPLAVRNSPKLSIIRKHLNVSILFLNLSFSEKHSRDGHSGRLSEDFGHHQGQLPPS